MISKTDIDIYEALFQVKTITEKYLGYTHFDWVFSSVKYHADCTLAIPFDPFDKVIVSILLEDESLSIEQIGEILGMNLIHDPENQIYKDEAEYDILRIALDNLNDYGVIEIEDTSYSICTLTSIGKQYAEKGYKFKVAENRPFTLFFDHITDNHFQAKKHFEKLKGTKSDSLNDFNFLDNDLIHGLAEVQEPEINNHELGSSFINPAVDYRNSGTFKLKIDIALIYDVLTNNTRLVALEVRSKTVNKYFTDYINQKQNDFLALFQKEAPEIGIDIVSQGGHVEYLKNLKNEIENQIASDPQRALQRNHDGNTESKFIDEEYFWLNLPKFVPASSDEIFLLIPEPSDFVISLISQLAHDNSSPTLFIVFQNPSNTIISGKLQELYKLSLKDDNKLFVAVYAIVSEFSCFINKRGKIYSVKEITLSFKAAEETFVKEFLENTEISNNQIPKYYSDIKKEIADDYLKRIEENIEEISEMEPPQEVGKAYILKQYDVTKKATSFENTELSDAGKASLVKIKRDISIHIKNLKVQHRNILHLKLYEFSQQFGQTSFENLEDINDVETSVKEMETEFFPDYKDLIKLCNQLKERITSEKNRIRNEVLAKTYIIDTNVFIKEPDIISKIDLKKDYVALPLSVIEELDRLKLRPANKINAEKAIKNINALLRTSKSAKESKVRRSRADLTLLPAEFQTKTADNMILSLGLVYKKNNPVILTLDRNFQSKAMLMDIALVTLNELLGINEMEKPKVNIKKSKKVDYVAIFKKINPATKNVVTIDEFLKAVKNEHPDFDLSKTGFKTPVDFVTFLHIFEVNKNKHLKLK